jgi:hypothetical protein
MLTDFTSELFMAKLLLKVTYLNSQKIIVKWWLLLPRSINRDHIVPDKIIPEQSLNSYKL